MSSNSSSSTKSRSRRNSRDKSPPPVIGRRQLLRRKSSAELSVNQIKNNIPVRLHGPLLDGKNPRKIFNYKSQRDDQGFNATMWRDEDGSKLYLDNLAADGAIDPQLKVTFQQVREMATRSEQLADEEGEPIPKSIVVRTNGSTDARLAAKKMIAEMLQQAGDDKKLYVLKESDPIALNPLPGGPLNNPITQVALTFQISSRALLDPIMESGDYQLGGDNLRSRMGGPPKDDVTINLGVVKPTLRKKSELYRGVVDALNEFHQVLRKNDETTEAIEKKELIDPYGIPIDAPAESLRKYAEIHDAADQLIIALDNYIDDSSTNPLKKSRREAKDKKKEVMQELKDRVVAAKNDGFKGELDKIRRARWQNINALDESQIVPGTSKTIGRGAQGDVKAATLRLDNGQDFRAALKPNQPGINQEADNADIPEDNPQQSARAVAAYRINQRLGMEVIPRTEYIILSDEEGRPQLGQALEFVQGSVGQRKGPVRDRIIDQGEIDQAELRYKRVAEGADVHRAELVENAKFDLENKYHSKQVDANTRHWFRIRDLPIDIDYADGVVQQGLADLQLVDSIIGHADRHSENLIYVKNDAGEITGVRGIDNDDVLGSGWKRRVPGDDTTSKTSGVPPFVDFSTALKILRADPESIRADLPTANDLVGQPAGSPVFSQAEQDAAVARFRAVQDEVKIRVKDQAIASNEDVFFRADIDELNRLAGRDADDLDIKSWGEDTITAGHKEDNSYLGNILTIKQTYGVASDV
ncbi:MAG: hypothetical protein QNJ45_24445 [Ardenticatenaceae bacterium]|nr:hypothetical protein [Ardenticatenaceae bacterium]